MALSQDLINQFVKLTNKEEKPKEVTVNGTYKTINGEEYVQIDGSEIWTPVTSTVEAETGERVKVLIKNHTATVTGNISSPSARNKSVKDLKYEVDENGNSIRQMDNTIMQQGNSIIQIDNNIKQVNNDILQANNAINQQGNVIKQLDNNINQQNNEISQINNKITQQDNNITQINNDINQQNNIITQHGNAINQQNNIINQQNNIINMHGNTMEVFDSNIQILNSAFKIEDGVLTGLDEIIVDELETNHLNAKYANIDFSNINQLAVKKIFSDSGLIKDLVVQSGKITGELVGVTIKGDLIEGNTIRADKLVVKGEDGLYYKLNIDGLNEISTTQASKVALTTSKPSDWDTNFKDYYVISNGKYVHVSGNSAPAWKASTYYKLSLDHESGLDGTVIIAKSVTADKVQVSDLVAFDATIGGFHIGDHSLYSGVKNSIDNTTRGVYMDDSGQVNIGDSNNFLKYFLDTSDNTYKLRISAGVITMGGISKTLEETINEIEESVDNIEIGGRNKYIIKNSSEGYLLQGDATRLGDMNQARKEHTSEFIEVNEGEEWIFQNWVTPIKESTEYLWMAYQLYNNDKSLYGDRQVQAGAGNSGILQYKIYKITIPKNVKYLRVSARMYQDGIIKLEKGNKPTDWTPAPEDIENQISKTVKTVDVEYYLSTSSTSVTGGSWSTTAPAWVDGKYMWSRQKVTYVDGTTATRNETCIAGAKGATGSPGGTGATGTGVESITEEYYLSTSKTSQTGGSWSTTQPTWSSGKYVWTRSKIVYKNPSSTSYTTPLCSSEWEAVNEINVGGRNILRGTDIKSITNNGLNSDWSKAEWGTPSGGDGVTSLINITDSPVLSLTKAWKISNNTTGNKDFAQFKIPKQNNTEFTFSVWCKGSGSLLFRKYITGGINVLNKAVSYSNWTRVSITFEESNLTGFQFGVTGSCTEMLFIAPKLEAGNKPTDWTPAPEDVYQAIDDVQIGGRNYVKNTSANWSDWWVVETTDTPDINRCKTITKLDLKNLNLSDNEYISLQIELETSNFVAVSGQTTKLWSQGSSNGKWSGNDGYFRNPWGSLFNISGIENFNKVNKFTKTFQITSEMINTMNQYGGLIELGFRCDYASKNAKVRWRYVKIERGNRVTDWSPAPEDTLSQTSEVIVGTQTGTTAAWTGVASFSSLEDNQQITYWLPQTSANNATLNLTLAGGGTTGAKPLYYGGTSRLGTHYPAGSVIHLTYRKNVTIGSTTIAEGWWADANYDSNNYDRIRLNNNIKAKSAITNSRLIVGDSGGYFHLAAGSSFDIDKPILWAGSDIAANGSGSNNYLSMPSCTIRNNTNSSWTATQNLTLYLVGVLSGNKFIVDSTTPFTTNLPTAENSQYYISLGYMISTYQIYLYPEHPIFKYSNGEFRNISQIAYEAFTSEVGGRNLILKTRESQKAYGGRRRKYGYSIYDQ